MLLLPFVENSFKHGASGTTGNVEIYIALSLKDQTLSFIVKNTVDLETEDSAPPRDSDGIGMKNIQRQLDLLYPGRYELHTGRDNGFFVASLNIRLRED